MKTVGIICEYNPFHNGHLYHLEKIKEMYPSSLIVLVMSSSFTERGDISILNKWEKTDIALHYGVDLVIELPFVFSTQSADIFAFGAISILNKMRVDTIVFGSESNDPNKLLEIANIQLNDENYNKIVKDYLDQGENYPTALSLALDKICNKTVTLPNDLLGLSYVREIVKQKANIEIKTIKRTNDFHNTELDEKIVSASAIRNNLDNNNIKKYIPSLTYQYLKNKKTNNEYFKLLKYKILCEQENIKIYQTVDEGIHNRILKYIDEVNSIEELIEKIKTKRYTYNKIHRMLTHILCGFTKEEAKNIKINYIRVLGFNQKGINYLNKIKKELDIPLITNYKKEYHDLLKIETKIDKLYSLIMSDKNNNYKREPIKFN